MNLDHDACYSAIRVRDARYDGRFFTAVKTTRIYCRPVCPARTPCRAMSSSTPRPRPRRRPASIPACAAARKSRPPPAPRRAARQRGARVAADRAGCAGRGRSGRAGRPDRRRRAPAAAAVPRAPGRLSVAVAQTRRVLLAATDPRDAPAHGRDRVRLGLWQHPPLQRALPAAVRPPARRPAPFLATGRTGRTRGRDPAAARYRPPYDWDAMLDFLRLRAIAGIEQVRGRRYTRSISLDGAQGTVAVEPGKGDALLATVRFPRLPSLPVIIARLRRQFDLDSDPAAIAAQLSHDPVLAALTAARPGLRIPGAWDGFELAMRAVLGQQITVVAAIRLGGKLVAAHGAPLARPEDGLTHVFPEPAAIAAADLAPLGMPRSRARTLGRGLGGAGGPDAVRGRQRSGRLGQAPAGNLGSRGMDGAVHRAAPAARAGRVPGGRHRPDPGAGSAGIAQLYGGGTAGALGRMAALAPMRPSSFGRRARRAEAARPAMPGTHAAGPRGRGPKPGLSRGNSRTAAAGRRRSSSAARSRSAGHRASCR